MDNSEAGAFVAGLVVGIICTSLLVLSAVFSCDANIWRWPDFVKVKMVKEGVAKWETGEHGRPEWIIIKPDSTKSLLEKKE